MDTQDIQQLPRVKFNFFIDAYTRSGKKLFVFLFTVLVFLGVWALFNGYFPFYWALDFIPVIDSMGSEVVIDKIEKNYRTINLFGKAFYNFTTFKSTLINTHPVSIFIYLTVLILGWAGILSAVSRINGLLSYILYFIFCCYIYFAEFGKIFLGNDSPLHKGVAFAVMLVFLITSQYLKQKTNPLSIQRQFILYSLLLTILHLAVYFTAGLPALHRTFASGFPVLIALTAFFTIFISKDITNFIFFICTNAEKVEKRKSPLFIAILTVGVLIAEAALLIPYFIPNFPINEYGLFRPLTLWLFAAIVTVFTSQNIYPQFKESIPSNLTFSTLISSLAIISVGTVAFLFSVGEIGFLKRFEFISIALFICVGFFHLIYVLVNFYPLLKEKQNIYYNLLFPRGVKFAFVWFMALGCVLFLEGNDLWRSYHQILATYRNLAADNAFLYQNGTDMKIALGNSLSYSENEPKANYNLGCLFSSDTSTMSVAENIETVAGFLARSAKFSEAGTLAYGNFLVMANKVPRAKNIFRQKIQDTPSPKFYTNLAYIYFQAGDADSCILTLKEGAQKFPKSALIYSNLAAVYAKYKKYDWAKRFAEAANDYDSKSESVQENFAYIALLQDEKKKGKTEIAPALNEERLLEKGAPGFRLNGAIWAYRQKKYALADKICTDLLKENEIAEALILKMLTQAEVDSFGNTLSRYLWLNTQYPEAKNIVNHNMGALYYKKGVPESAAYYFSQSESPEDKLLHAQALIDAGAQEEAYDKLSVLRVDFPETVGPIALREMELLDLAYENSTAGLQWDFSDISFEEAMRAGIYGGTAGTLSAAVKFYQPLVDADPKITLPYLEIGRLYLKIGDAAGALVQFDAGLPRDPQNFLLNLEKARALLLLDKKSEAENIIARLTKENPKDSELRFLLAEKAMKENNLKAAIATLIALHKENPFETKYILPLADIYATQNENDLGYRLISQAVKINSKNSELWRRFGEFAFRVSLFDDATFGYEKAVECALNKKSKAELQKALQEMQARVKSAKGSE